MSRLAMIVLIAVSCLAGLAAGQVVILPGSFSQGLTGISADGQQVGGEGQGHPYFFWSQASGYTFFDHPGVPLQGLPALSGDGRSLMGVSGAIATLNRTFITANTGDATFLPLSAPGQVNQSNPTGISRDGSVVCGWDTHTSSSIQVGWRWSASGGMQILPFLALAMSGDGNTVFGHTGGGQHLMWQNGVTTTIPGGGTWISAINDDGSIFAGLSGQGKTIWNHGQPTIVPLLPGRTLGTFTDINEDGTVAVGIDRTGQSGSELPFIWTPSGGTQPLGAYFASYGYDLSGYRIFNAHVSDDGRTFALGATPIGGSIARGIIVTVPCPATLGLLVGLFASARRTR
ncbi:MAG: hypothetical protein DYG92_08140 [Leptolyngbya sp. PLA1]|nr:hypothetical protein [Leptolyngbya sp. PLA1]